ncbi:MAG: heavy-metal-associated domain-containing protein [Noviherbaspirillum sp.]
MLQYTVEDMSCQHCVNAITAAVTQAAPGATVDIDLERRLVRVDRASDSEQVSAAIRDAGYTPVRLP